MTRKQYWNAYYSDTTVHCNDNVLNQNGYFHPGFKETQSHD